MSVSFHATIIVHALARHRNSSALARSAAKCVRAHDLPMPLRKRLMLSVNPIDPSSARRRGDATSRS
jgi:hypothetical protein